MCYYKKKLGEIVNYSELKALKDVIILVTFLYLLKFLEVVN